MIHITLISVTLKGVIGKGAANEVLIPIGITLNGATACTQNWECGKRLEKRCEIEDTRENPETEVDLSDSVGNPEFGTRGAEFNSSAPAQSESDFSECYLDRVEASAGQRPVP